MARIPVVGGNWKCNGTLKSAEEIVGTLNGLTLTHPVEVVAAPPATLLAHVVTTLREPHCAVAAQNVYTQTGAFTGELAPSMLTDLRVGWAIVGHSERRKIFLETDAMISSKVAACLAAGIRVIACCGESLAERDAPAPFFPTVIAPQLAAIAAGVPKDGALSGDEAWRAALVIAYEPVWAIGTGRTATPAQAQEVHAAIRAWVAANVSPAAAAAVRILYGGSVTAANSAALWGEADVDGFLVGGACLKPEFAAIVAATAAAK